MNLQTLLNQHAMNDLYANISNYKNGFETDIPKFQSSLFEIKYFVDNLSLNEKIAEEIQQELKLFSYLPI